MGNVHEGIVQSKLVIIIKIDDQSYTSRHGITLNKSKLGLEQKKKKKEKDWGEIQKQLNKNLKCNDANLLGIKIVMRESPSFQEGIRDQGNKHSNDYLEDERELWEKG